jgi:hypothetical protein
MALINTVSADQNESSEFAVSAGSPATLYLISATDQTLPADARAWVLIKGSNSKFYTVGELNTANNAQILDGAGTFKVVKGPAGTAFGVDKT